MMGKRRFGVSVDKGVSEELERLARELGLTRSQLVEEALRWALGSLVHEASPEHECHGLIVARGGELGVQEVVEELGESVRASLHYHVGERCYSVVVFKGSSGRLRRALDTLRARGTSVFYLPLH